MYRDTRFGEGEWLLTVVKGHLTHTFILESSFSFPSPCLQRCPFPHSMQCSLCLRLQNHASSQAQTQTLFHWQHWTTHRVPAPHFPLGLLNPQSEPYNVCGLEKEARNGDQPSGDWGCLVCSALRLPGDLQQVSAVQAGQEACRTLQDE